MEYRPDLKSTFWFSLELSLLFLAILYYILNEILFFIQIPYQSYIEISLFIICFIRTFVITYKYTKVNYKNNTIILTKFKKTKQYNLNDFYLHRNYSRIEHPTVYWHKGKFREYKDKTTMAISKCFRLTSKSDKRKNKYIILSFLEINDFMDLKEKILSEQNNNKNDISEQNDRITNDKHEYNIKTKEIKNNMSKTYNKWLFYLLLCIAWFYSSLNVIYSENDSVKNNHLLRTISACGIIVIVFYISKKIPKILAGYQIKQIKNKIPSTIKIEKNLIIDDNTIEFNDVKRIYTNSYIDNLENEVKCLVIHTKTKKYIYCLDYILDNHINFVSFEDLCNNLKRIFGTTFSSNTITR